MADQRQMQLRRGTTTQWGTANTVLLAGEIGLDTTLGVFKIGDGTTAWSALPSYLSGGTDPEIVRDTIATALAGSGLVSVASNDASDTITITTTATANASDAALRDRSTHTGTQSADTLTDGSTNRLYTSTEKTKLSGVATGATANDTNANLLARANHTGTQSADTVVDGTTNKAYTATEKTKLSGIATAATANSTDAILLARANHTGSQAISTVTNLQTTLDAKVASNGTVLQLVVVATRPATGNVGTVYLVPSA